MPDGQYRIFKAQLPLIGGVAGHNMLVLVDPNGRVIGELDGLATDADGNIKPIGYLPSDRLKIYPYREAYFYRPDLRKAELVSGDQATIMNLWNAANEAGARMNALNLRYPFLGLGQNSNSAASTLIAAMGLAEPPMSDGAPVTPGTGSLLLDPKTLQELKRQFKLDISQTDSVRDVAVPSQNPGEIERFGPQSPRDAAERPLSSVEASPGRSASTPSNRSFEATGAKPSSMPIPGATGPTSIGGATGPTPLLPPRHSPPRAPARGSMAAPAQDGPGGILGMLIDAGHVDPENPDPPPAGGLLGLIQDTLRHNPAASGRR